MSVQEYSGMIFISSKFTWYPESNKLVSSLEKLREGFKNFKMPLNYETFYMRILSERTQLIQRFKLSTIYAGVKKDSISKWVFHPSGHIENGAHDVVLIIYNE